METIFEDAHRNFTRTPGREPSPFLGGGEKVAAGRMRGGAACADAHPSPQPSPLLGGRERESERVEFLRPIAQAAEQ